MEYTYIRMVIYLMAFFIVFLVFQIGMYLCSPFNYEDYWVFCLCYGWWDMLHSSRRTVFSSILVGICWLLLIGKFQNHQAFYCKPVHFDLAGKKFSWQFKCLIYFQNYKAFYCKTVHFDLAGKLLVGSLNAKHASKMSVLLKPNVKGWSVDNVLWFFIRSKIAGCNEMACFCLLDYLEDFSDIWS